MSITKSFAKLAEEKLKDQYNSKPKEGMKGIKDPDAVDHGAPITDPKDAGKDFGKSTKKDTSVPTKDKGEVAIPKMKAPTVKEEEELEEEEVFFEEEDEEDEDDGDDKVEVDGEEDEGDDEDDSSDDESDDEEDVKEENAFSFATLLDKKFKLDVTNDIQEMFNGDDFSDEFKEKAATIYEAAVRTKIKSLQQEMAEVADEIMAEEVERIEDELAESIDDFLKVVMTEWLEENEVAIENSIRTEIAEDFMDGLKNLFKEHYIEVPEAKVDIVEELQAHAEELEESLNAEIAEKTENYKYIRELESQIVFNDIVKQHKLSLAQEEKVRELAEDLDIADLDKYTSKVNTLVENLLAGENKETKVVKPLKEEIGEQIETKTFDAQAKAVADSLTRRFSR